MASTWPARTESIFTYKNLYVLITESAKIGNHDISEHVVVCSRSVYIQKARGTLCAGKFPPIPPMSARKRKDPHLQTMSSNTWPARTGSLIHTKARANNGICKVQEL